MLEKRCGPNSISAPKGAQNRVGDLGFLEGVSLLGVRWPAPVTVPSESGPEHRCPLLGRTDHPVPSCRQGGRRTVIGFRTT